jgi:hypothetical protein
MEAIFPVKYILDYTVMFDGGVTRGSIALDGEDTPDVGDVIRVSIQGRDTVMRVDTVRPGMLNYGIQHFDLDCSPQSGQLY